MACVTDLTIGNNSASRSTQYRHISIVAFITKNGNGRAILLVPPEIQGRHFIPGSGSTD